MSNQNDLFDMLNISKEKDHTKDGTLAKHVSRENTKISNNQQSPQPQPMRSSIQKELYNLIGNGVPSTVLTSNKKMNLKLGSAKPSSWVKEKFKPNEKSRVILEHWVKGQKNSSEENVKISKYSSYNHKYMVPSFSKNEFESFMKLEIHPHVVDSDDKKADVKLDQNKLETIKTDPKTDETKIDESENKAELKTPDGSSEISNLESLDYDEVKYIFDLVRDYDMKWIVIYDRYDFEDKIRTVEDLKDIFYRVCRNYFKSTEADNAAVQDLLQYPKEKEIERKKYLTRLLSRSSAEVAEEEALIIEAKKFEMAAKKTSMEREQLLQLLDTPVPLENIDITEFLTSQGLYNFYASLMSDKSRKRKYEHLPENPWMKQQQRFKTQKTKKIEDESASKRKQQQLQQQTAQNGSNEGDAESANKKPKVEFSQPENIITQLLREFDQEERKQLGIRLHENKLSPGVFLRSTKISTFKPAIQNKVTSALNEMKIPLRPVMPTFDVIKKNDEFLKKITQLLDLKKQVDKLEAEIQIRK